MAMSGSFLKIIPLAMGVSTLTLVSAGIAQEANGLRGLVRESDVNAALLPDSAQDTGQTDPQPTASTGIPTPAYQPFNAGTGLDAEPDPLPEPRPLSTARERERARRGEPADGEQTADQNQAEAGAQAPDAEREENFRNLRTERSVPTERLNDRVAAIEGTREQREENPYAPIGLRLGTFTVIPTLEQGLTWNSNPDYSPNGGEAILSETTLRLNATSDWSRHAATVSAYGTARKSLSGVSISDLEGGVNGELRLDINTQMRARAALGYSLRPESASSPVIISGVEDRPLRHDLDASLGVEKDVGKLRLGVTGAINRSQYGDAGLVGGGTLSQEERNATLAALRLRAGYQVSPALTPFVEAEVGRRFYDIERDSQGFERSANRLALRTGVALDIEEKLSGEISAGWISEDIDDERLGTISGLALAANLAWSPQRGTMVRLNGSTTIEGTTDTGESGSILYSSGLTLERQIRANLVGEAAATANWRDYASGGHDLTLAGQVGLTWWLNRSFGLTGRARYEKQTSSLPGRGYDATSVFMGIRMQR